MGIKIYKACNTLIDICAKCKVYEKILIVTDPDSFQIAEILWKALEGYPKRSLVMMPTQTMHGQEPTDLVAKAMMEADVIFRPTTFSISNTEAKRKACENGARDLNCSDYDIKMLESGGLYADFEAQKETVDKVAELIEGGKIVIKSDSGTNITASIKGRKSFPQYGMSTETGQTSSPPDIECAIGANAGTMNGVVIIDGSIPHPKLGLIEKPIRIEIENSKVVDISGGSQAKMLLNVLREFGDLKVYHVGEIGIGLNPECTLTGRMLEDEGCFGTVHFGLGDDRGFGGTNACPVHLDMVFRAPSIFIDDRKLMDKGVLCL
jgi:leucyl aminopeptidase (aminopeptidase T)